MVSSENSYGNMKPSAKSKMESWHLVFSYLIIKIIKNIQIFMYRVKNLF